MKTSMKMKSKKVTALSVILTLLLSGLFPLSSERSRAQTTVSAQRKGLGQVVRSYQEAQDQRGAQPEKQKQGRPAWVENAFERSLRYFSEKRQTPGLPDSKADLRLLSALQDDRGLTHVRMKQFHKGVEVFGTQVIAHLDETAVREVTGDLFNETQLEISPGISAEQAIEAARSSLGYGGEFATPPTAKLTALPHRFFRDDSAVGATLTYLVELHIEDGTEATALHRYFVNAQDGSVVWHYDALPKGLGHSLYSGDQNISTLWFLTYFMTDPAHGNSRTVDMRNGETGGGESITDSDDVWGDGTVNDRQSAAVDAHFGLAKTWDYFQSKFGRRGMDGENSQIVSRVHFSSNFNNAFYTPNSNILTYGDGDGSQFNPLVSLDVVAHEFTHGVTERIAGLVYAGESGAINESYSDIFGTAVEFYSGINPDYLIGEDCTTPGVAGDALRSMADPPSFGNPDHYSRRYTGAGDYGGVHINSGIMNKAFYLIAEGGTHPLSGIQVTGIGRERAERLFYHALLFELLPNSRFIKVRIATVKLAAQAYGYGSPEHRAVARAWDAVGVLRQESFDFDGDGRTDRAVWRPGDGIWHTINSSTGGYEAYQWGASGDIIVPGDYDGDGRTDRAVWRPSNGTWYIVNSSTGVQEAHQYGLFLDVPAPGDYDGDGRTDRAVWRRAEGNWHIMNSSTGLQEIQQWGASGDVPVPGDYDGDSRTDRAVWRPSNGVWYIVNSSTGASVEYQWGAAGDVPAPGDYDADGVTDRAVWRRGTGVWHIILSNNGLYLSPQWGNSGDDPIPGDYDGDGKTDYAVWRPSEGNWYIVRSSGGAPTYQWGAFGDVPAPKANKYKNPLTGGPPRNCPFCN